jgi:hypothetical protein
MEQRDPAQPNARLLSIASGPAALLVFLAYIFYSLSLGLPAALLFPAYGVVLALYFRKANCT